MKLNVSEWKEFNISKLFLAQTGDTDITKELLTDDGLPVVSAGVADTGIIGKTSVKARVFNKNTITIDMFGYACARPYQYKMVTHARCFSLSVIDYVLTTNQCLFLSQMLNYSSFKFAYGRMCSWERIKNDTLRLPIQYNSDGSPLLDNTCKYSEQGYVPDWQFMEDYIKSLHYKPLTTKRVNEKKIELNVSQWEDFYLGDLFDEMYKGKSYTDEDLEGIVSERVVPYITRTDMDNGCKYMANVTSDFNIEKGNAISIGDTTATCFYQKNDFITGDHMVVLRASWLNQLRGLFFIGLFGLEKLKYSYGRAYKMDNIKKTIFKLPIQRNADGSPVIDKEKKYHNKGYIPDWQFMENYINSLPYSDRII